MQSSTRFVGAFLFAAGVFCACSSSPARPPIDTQGAATPGSGGSSGATPSNDAGATSSDGGATVAASEDGGGVPVDGGVCTAGNCSGCCDSVNLCHSGGSASACGQLGVLCQVCTAGESCVGNTCQ
jgi:hypothetical protein